MIDIKYKLKSKTQPIISNSFNQLIVKSKEKLTLDKIGIIQFVLLLYPLYGRTFIEEIKSIYNNEAKYRLDYNEEREGYKKENEDLLWEILLDNVKTITREDNLIYGIGNSGGLDSRVILFCLRQLNRNIAAYTFGDSPSDAVYIANQVAHILKFQNQIIDVNHDFLRNHYHESIEYNPMYSLIYAWYLSARENLPHFDIHITGFNGDNMLGSHLTKELRLINKVDELYSYIFNHYRVVQDEEILKCLRDKTLLTLVYDDYLMNIRKSNNKKNENIFDEFNFVNRQRNFIAKSNNFHYCNNTKWYSPFALQNFIDFSLNLTYEERFGRKLYHRTALSKMKKLSTLRFERSPYSLLEHTNKFFYLLKKYDFQHHPQKYNKGSHKNVGNWLAESNSIEFVKASFKRGNVYFDEIFDSKYITNHLEDLFEQNKYLVMNLLTVKIWLDKYFL